MKKRIGVLLSGCGVYDGSTNDRYKSNDSVLLAELQAKALPKLKGLDPLYRMDYVNFNKLHPIPVPHTLTSSLQIFINYFS